MLCIGIYAINSTQKIRMFAFAYPSLCRSYIAASNTHSIFAVLSSYGQQFETAAPLMPVLVCETSLKFRHFTVNFKEFSQLALDLCNITISAAISVLCIYAINSIQHARMFAFAYPRRCWSYIAANNTHSTFTVLSSYR